MPHTTGLIEAEVLLSIADRAATQFGMLNTVFETIGTTGTSGAYVDRVTDTNNVDFEIPCENTYYGVDNDMTLRTCVASGTPLTKVVTAMDSHFSRVGHTGGWDAFLTTNDERVSDYFNQIYYYAKNSYMLANNVFSETNDNFGQITFGAGNSYVYVDGINYGTGASTNKADGTNFAASQLRALLVTKGGGTNKVFTLNVKNKLNVATTIVVTIPGATSQGDYVDIGTAANRFLDVTGVASVASSDNGDVVQIYNHKERQVEF